MYDILLDSSYNEAVQKFSSAVDVNSVRKVITFKDDANVKPFCAQSDIIVYYDVISDSKPLLLIERIRRKNVSTRKVKSAVKNMNRYLVEYNASYRLSTSGEYIDIIIVKMNIHTKLSEVK